MKNKIGILTFHQCINYGAILQSFALQKVLNDNNLPTEIIDYRNKIFENKYTYKHLFIKRNIKYMLYDFLTFPCWAIKKRKFDNFKKDYIKLSPKIKECTDELNYDKYVVGSDQVWNTKTTGFDKNYFLDFIDDKKKKFSYAASFGVSQIEDQSKEECKKMLSTFNKISVREEQGKKIINQLINKEVEVVLDPTLLISADEWIKYAKIPKEQKYVLVYQLAYSKTLIDFAQKIALEKNCKIITIDGNPRQPMKAKYVLTAGPSEWLGLFYNADYVITNSFHGLAFSINLNKNFYFEYLGNGLTVNSRLKNMTEKFKIEDRLIENNTPKINYQLPNYKKINEILKKERNKSLDWLLKSMNNN